MERVSSTRKLVSFKHSPTHELSVKPGEADILGFFELYYIYKYKYFF